jgi:hypothetical protein
MPPSLACASCGAAFARAAYTKAQLSKNGARRCAACVAASAAAPGGAPRGAPPSSFFVRVKIVGGIYADVALADGAATTVARLAQIACDASPLRSVALHLAAAGGDDLPSPAAEAAAPLLAQVGWALARAGVGCGAWLVARFAPPAMDRARLEQLLIRPTFSVAPSSSASSGSGARSPLSDDGFPTGQSRRDSDA